PPPPKDEFQFDVHIYPDDVAINDGQIDIEIRNLPRPMGKFFNVAKLCYQNMQSSQLMFDYINIDESAKFSFSNLLSNTRLARCPIGNRFFLFFPAKLRSMIDQAFF